MGAGHRFGAKTTKNDAKWATPVGGTAAIIKTYLHPNMKLRRTFVVTILPLLLSSAASADVVANYTFVSSSPASSDTDPSMAGNFTVYIGNSVVTSGNGGISGTSMGGAYLKANADYAASESDAVTNGTYYSFTITPDTGTALQLTSLTFQLGGTANNQGSFSVTAFLRTSADNFSADAGMATSGSLTYSIPNNTTSNFGPLVTIDLSSMGSISATTTLRIYSYINTNSPDGVYARINEVALNATTAAIPEPSACALGLGACVGLFALWRRGKKPE